MIKFDKDTLNKLIISNNDANLINYISDKLNIHHERLSIVLIDYFETEKLVIDKNNQFVIILNNSENETITINNVTFEEILCLDNDNDIIINSNVKFSDLTFLVFNDNCKQSINSVEKINEYINKDFSLNIMVIEDPLILNTDDCDYFVNVIDSYINSNVSINNNWCPGNNVNCKTFFINDKPDTALNMNLILYNEIKNKVSRIFKNLEDYLNKNTMINAKGNSGYQFRKIYGSTRIHKDGIYDSNYLINFNVTRIASVVICLNDNYEGGEFYFPIQNITVKLKKGQIIVFPPYWTHPHLTKELKNRTYRYTINSWIYENTDNYKK